ncbi:MAG: menaquinol oxidoreductase [Candidatus Aquicultor secundus]|uniref:Menaquinol oxidoreductase n=1 Tax=Candidatus Aquicultor secundus TaxID=1973895 RepID=A0A2M7T5X7_9ACTN|nr:NrfD/PsrC family molybdoenzyme membrane anchor subunit [Candidatus Aquicultor secundus]NCO65399.1 polysulfide reductase NrfD [Solirubrobacter sp.]OIO88530.1 MAG: menaquinol oxidoreductase [Candidatus Aquicultor secundus]PIU27543.1 MAG: menaquinol oxidoreductase [Candidatus Aquicultor secundus]PIW21906.1 MAG: menaquinol oxidoreductase [Candidatus Aquicultor secundus]PIX52678.1 MAG: menaquinol oxidoreductase [Candidatus Aquicultor secundus]
MLEKALSGSRNYWTWVLSLLAVIGVGVIFYLRQFDYGLGVTGMSRDVSWGLYIGQFTFFVGVAASAVMLVIPFYLHNYKKFGRMVILGEFLAVSAVLMCMLFIFVDMGQPTRVVNMFLHPTPNSVMFFDAVVLFGYLLLNITIGWTSMNAEKKGFAPPAWVKPLVYISIPWAFSIHTVTAFLYAGLPGREYWLTAIMAARFLASAFAAGPALLIILAIIVRKVSKFDPGKEAIKSIGKIVAYAMAANVFFLLLEVFTAFYSSIPGEKNPFFYLYAGLQGHGRLVLLMWTSAILAVISLVLLIVPKTRNTEKTLLAACGAVFASLWIDKGFGLVVGGFVPNPFGTITEYWPTIPESFIVLAVWAIGALVLTILYKVAISIREENAGIEIEH